MYVAVLKEDFGTGTQFTHQIPEPGSRYLILGAAEALDGSLWVLIGWTADVPRYTQPLLHHSRIAKWNLYNVYTCRAEGIFSAICTNTLGTSVYYTNNIIVIFHNSLKLFFMVKFHPSSPHSGPFQRVQGSSQQTEFSSFHFHSDVRSSGVSGWHRRGDCRRG